MCAEVDRGHRDKDCKNPHGSLRQLAPRFPVIIAGFTFERTGSLDRTRGGGKRRASVTRAYDLLAQPGTIIATDPRPLVTGAWRRPVGRCWRRRRPSRRGRAPT